MKYISPIIPGLRDDELVWAGRVPALPVNPQDEAGSLVVRFRLSWWDRIKALFGHDLYIWQSVYDAAPQWVTPFFDKPTCVSQIINSTRVLQILPVSPRKWNRHMAQGPDICVPNPLPDRMSEKLEPMLESELRKTLPEKLAERKKLRDAELAQAKKAYADQQHAAKGQPN